MKKTILELAKQVQQENLDTMGKMSERKIAKIIREAFKQVKNDIDNTEDDRVQIPKFGNFRVRMIEREKDGEITTVRRIVFRPAKVKE